MGIFKKGPDKELLSEIEELKETVVHAKMPEVVEKVAFKEIDRLAKTSPSSAEYTIGINYIDYLVSLPWNKLTDDNLDIKRAESVLDEEHFGLSDIKDRILEHLAVRILKLSRKHTILVVDDEEMTRRNLEHVFVKDGHHVDMAASGEEAIQLCARVLPDVVLMDIIMPDMDGVTATRAIRQQFPEVQIIALTSFKERKLVQDAVAAGMAAST